jgi:tRNA-dihydrouridine synthase
MKNYLDNLPKPFLVLAPMEDVTDTVFRRVIGRIAPFDLYMTEFVNVDGLQSSGRTATAKRLRFEAQEQPLIGQIWGDKPENFYKTTLELIEMGFVGVDINMGCPVKAVVKNACGGGLIDHPEKAAAIIKAVQQAANGKIPVSVKTRIGMREYRPEWIETLLKQNLNMLTIHLRTVKEMSSVDAHWELMHDIKKLRDKIAPQTALVGNGDVQNRKHATELVKEYGIDGAMIGRGVFHDPYAAMTESLWPQKTTKDKLDLYQHHIKLYQDTWDDNGRPPVALNKFCKVYVSGFDGAKEMREKLMHCASTDELLESVLLKSEQQ